MSNCQYNIHLQMAKAETIKDTVPIEDIIVDVPDTSYFKPDDAEDLVTCLIGDLVEEVMRKNKVVGPPKPTQTKWGYYKLPQLKVMVKRLKDYKLKNVKVMVKKLKIEECWLKVGPANFRCATCGGKTKTKYNMEVHVKSHFGQAGRKFVCATCNERFVRRQEWMRHKPTCLGHNAVRLGKPIGTSRNQKTDC